MREEKERISELEIALCAAREALEMIAGLRIPYDLLVTNKEIAFQGLLKSKIKFVKH